MPSETCAPDQHPCRHSRTERGCAECRVRLVSVCAALTSDELDELERLSRHIALGARQTLFSQDEEATAVFNITEGAIRLSRLLPDGRRHVMGFALVGDFLGLALLERQTVTAEALSPVAVCRFERESPTCCSACTSARATNSASRKTR
jgi:CRP/FNR family transcriptional regulator